MTDSTPSNIPADTEATIPTGKHTPPFQVAVQEEIVHFAGYPPEVLEKFENVLQGSAEKLLDNMLRESDFRRRMEEKALDANIATQEDFRKYNLRAVINESWLHLPGELEAPCRHYCNTYSSSYLGVQRSICC